MRAKQSAIGLLGLLVTGAAAYVGCGTYYDDLYVPLTDPALARDGGGEGGGGGNPACDADPTEDPAAVIEDCGVFVSASAAPGGDGTKAKPFGSFAEAAASSVKRVYACAESYAESNGVRFSGGVEIYAGFTACDDADTGWTWSADAKATLNGPSDTVALALQSGDNRVQNLDVVAPDAVAEGASSIALVIEGGSLAMQNGNVTAGAAKDGANGASLAADTTLNGTPGNDGSDACMGDLIQGNPGAATTTKMCAGGAMTVGGKGGDGGRAGAGRRAREGHPSLSAPGRTGVSGTACTNANPGQATHSGHGRQGDTAGPARVEIVLRVQPSGLANVVRHTPVTGIPSRMRPAAGNVTHIAINNADAGGLRGARAKGARAVHRAQVVGGPTSRRPRPFRAVPGSTGAPRPSPGRRAGGRPAAPAYRASAASRAGAQPCWQ